MMRKYKAKAGKTMKAQRGSKVVKKDTTNSKKQIIKRLQSDGEKAMEKLELGKLEKLPSKAKAGLETPKPSQKGLKKLPTAVRNKMGYAKKGKKVKKAQAGGVASKAKKAPMVDADGAWTKVQERTIAGKKMAKKGASVKKAKSGAKMGKCKYGCN